MFKCISLLVCILGVSLASGLSGLRNGEVQDMLKAVKKHQGYFDLCRDELGQELSACSDVYSDLATLEDDVTGAVSTAMNFYGQGMDLYAQYLKCGTENIFKKVSCYEKVYKSATTLILTVETDVKAFPAELSPVVTKLEDDVASCISSGYTSQLLNSKMALCKLRLMLKN